MKKVYSFIFLLIVLSAQPVCADNKPSHFDVEVIGEGKPILLIPGFTSDKRVWKQVAAPLAKQYQVHLISLAGFGQTPAVAEPSLNTVKTQIVSYIEDKNLSQPAVMGHSLGGFMGLWLASTAPDLIGPVVSVDGLPFIGPLFNPSPDVTVASLKPQADMIKAYYLNLDAKGMKMAAMQGINRQASLDEHRELILAMAEQSDPATAAEAIYTMMTTDLRQSLHLVEKDILLLGASGGFANDQAKQRVASLYNGQMRDAKHSRVEMATDSRHFIMYDQPDWLLNQANAFLQEAL